MIDHTAKHNPPDQARHTHENGMNGNPLANNSIKMTEYMRIVKVIRRREYEESQNRMDWLIFI